MIAKERGFLLLTSTLGDPARKPLTVAQFRTLTTRVRQMEKPQTPRALQPEDLVRLGYDWHTAGQIVRLLADEQMLEQYIARGEKYDCVPISRVSTAYPAAVRQRLGMDAPACLWAKGDITLLSAPAVALVGSRDLQQPNRNFAQRLGIEAARQGIALVSGNARGADRTAQDACLDAGGKVICVVADQLQKHPLQKNVLYLSEDSFDLSFSSQRALSRNRIIHALGYMTFVAGCSMGRGGTWDGTTRNLANGWSPVFCYDDGSCAIEELIQMGASSVAAEQLQDLSALQTDMIGFL